jgi:hypothetical protein
MVDGVHGVAHVINHVAVAYTLVHVPTHRLLMAVLHVLVIHRLLVIRLRVLYLLMAIGPIGRLQLVRYVHIPILYVYSSTVCCSKHDVIIENQ